MKRRVLSILPVVFFMILSSLSAYDVNRTELDLVRDKHIRFVSYVGPHSKIETREQIRDIGRALGRSVAAGESRASWYGRYDLEHLIPGRQDEKLEADIFSLSTAAEVDDIRNLRLILTGFLQEAYGYSDPDASLLAEYISIYNAVYRGIPEYFRNRYVDEVVRLLDPLSTGLSNLYSDWPGKTQIVIPLTPGAVRGSLNTLDTGIMTDGAVTETLRKQDDMGVDLRKDMVDLKERQIDEAEETIVARTGEIAAELEKIAVEKRKTAERLEEVREEKTIVLSNPPEPAREDRIAALDDREGDLRKQQEKLAAEEAAAARKASAVEDEARKLEEKKEEVRAERERIAADQQSLIRTEPALDSASGKPAGSGKKESADGSGRSTEPLKEQAAAIPVRSTAPGTASSGKIVFFRLIDSGGALPSGQLVLLDVASGSTRTVSELNSVLGREFVPLNGRLLVLAGRAERGGSVRLFLLDPGTLMVTAEGRDEMFPASALVPAGDGFIAVTGREGVWKLGLFDSSLTLRMTCDELVDPYTSIVVEGEKVFFQARNGDILSAGIKDLKLIR